MDKDREFHIGSLIELKDGFGQHYPGADAGHRAVVKDIKETDGFLMLYVRWLDEVEEEGWSFASHFKFISDTDQILPRLGMRPDNASSEEEYMDKVFQAVDAASDSEAFFLLALKPAPNTPKGRMLVPQLFCVSNSESAAFLIEAQIMSIASDMFRNVVQEAIQHFNDFDS